MKERRFRRTERNRGRMTRQKERRKGRNAAEKTDPLRNADTRI